MTVEDESNLESLKRPQLLKLCKKFGIKAVGTNASLIEQIKEKQRVPDQEECKEEPKTENIEAAEVSENAEPVAADPELKLPEEEKTEISYPNVNNLPDITLDANLQRITAEEPSLLPKTPKKKKSLSYSQKMDILHKKEFEKMQSIGPNGTPRKQVSKIPQPSSTLQASFMSPGKRKLESMQNENNQENTNTNSTVNGRSILTPRSCKTQKANMTPLKQTEATQVLEKSSVTEAEVKTPLKKVKTTEVAEPRKTSQASSTPSKKPTSSSVVSSKKIKIDSQPLIELKPATPKFKSSFEARKAFDLKASLSRPLNYKPHKGPLSKTAAPINQNNKK